MRSILRLLPVTLAACVVELPEDASDGDGTATDVYEDTPEDDLADADGSEGEAVVRSGPFSERAYTVLTDPCGFDDILRDYWRAELGDYIPDQFDVVAEADRFFIEAVQDGVLVRAPVECTVDGDAFECTPQRLRGSYLVGWELGIVYEGDVVDDETLEGTATVTYTAEADGDYMVQLDDAGIDLSTCTQTLELTLQYGRF